MNPRNDDNEDEDIEDVDEDNTDDKSYRGGPKRHSDSGVLAGVRAYVDVRSGESGEDNSLWFEEQLEQLGAKVLSSFGSTCTHLVYKDGTLTTFRRWKCEMGKAPTVVRVSWVATCARTQSRVPEDEHLNDISGEFPAGIDSRKFVRPRRSAVDANDTSMDICTLLAACISHHSRSPFSSLELGLFR
ncbi:hypothetical protein CYLTODRAFT_360339 [Cylindrobasidium torrendii FP15055 ss-10]|uniref:BRCT domain-containing protein n=1 Tax=Cylindrobasidium torrendii FP15055 ss-10 TaxID=1314674 RepID=A0A0D7AZ44_9AGAR|nr:hypothetical protein CYLTODRAFT_360339 [Cylindrobasidium torrendii FP15055 ss-10]